MAVVVPFRHRTVAAADQVFNEYSDLQLSESDISMNLERNIRILTIIKKYPNFHYSNRNTETLTRALISG